MRTGLPTSTPGRILEMLVGEYLPEVDPVTRLRRVCRVLRFQARYKVLGTRSLQGRPAPTAQA